MFGRRWGTTTYPTGSVVAMFALLTHGMFPPRRALGKICLASDACWLWWHEAVALGSQQRWPDPVHYGVAAQRAARSFTVAMK
jgi:hypothetical protein